MQEDYKKVLLGFILKPQFTLTQHRPQAAMLQDEKCRKKKKLLILQTEHEMKDDRLKQQQRLDHITGHTVTISSSTF